MGVLDEDVKWAGEVLGVGWGCGVGVKEREDDGDEGDEGDEGRESRVGV